MAYTPQDFREVIAALASGTLNTAGLITDILSVRVSCNHSDE